MGNVRRNFLSLGRLRSINEAEFLALLIGIQVKTISSGSN